jgi:ribose transport system permease protein
MLLASREERSMKKELGILVLLGVLCAVVSIMDPRFISGANLQNQARLIGMYGIFSIGMGVVIITSGIDLSVGSIFALQGVLLAIMLREWHWPWPVAVASIVAGTMALGAMHGLLVTVGRLQPFIVTLCGLLFYRGAARFIASDEAKGFGTEGFGMLRELATGSVWGVPMPFIVLLGVAVIMWLVLHRSVYGRYLFAVGRNEEAARYSGINSRLIIGSAYVVSATLAGVAGILIAFYTNSISPSGHGTFYELYGIAAAVLGGCSLKGGEGSVLGIVIGTALMQVLRNLVNLLGIPSSLEFAVMGAVILAGVMVDQFLMHRPPSRRAGSC